MSAHVVILAGGFGKRLAPLSTEDCPKQFLDLTGEGISLFQQTVNRALQVATPKNIWPVANIIHEGIVLSQLEDTHREVAHNVLFEDESKNTAHAIYLAAGLIKKGVVVVMPADHIINGDFTQDINAAKELAMAGKIVAFGIKPESPDTNFGYLHAGGFHEKPDSFEAEKLIGQGALWNSGIFIFLAETVLEEFKRLHGQTIPAISFDKAIMEKTDKLAVIPASFEWADLGSWEALKNFSRIREFSV